MNRTRQVTIVALIATAIIVWGFGLGAVLQPSPTANQRLTAGTLTPQAPSEQMAATTLSSPAPTSKSPGEAAATPSTLTPAALLLNGTPAPSPTAISTRQPTIASAPSPIPFRTPTIPRTGRFLLVNQDEQMMHVYENGVEIRSIPVSTGAPVANAFTPAWSGVVGRFWGGGPFRDTNLWADYMWYLFPGAEGSILIHSVPYTRSGDLKIYDRPDALGVRPASRGCVRISPEDAQWLKAWDPVGVPIEITSWSGEIGPPDDSL